MDAALAQDFDAKLREVMEVLSAAVNSEVLLKSIKREKSLSAKVDLLTTCAEKVFDYLADLGGHRALNGVVIGVVDGIRDAYEDLQTSHMEVVGQLELARAELARNQSETHQLLEAAEHLEGQNNANRDRALTAEAELMETATAKAELEKYTSRIEREHQRLKEESRATIDGLSRQLEAQTAENERLLKELESFKRGFDTQRSEEQPPQNGSKSRRAAVSRNGLNSASSS